MITPHVEPVVLPGADPAGRSYAEPVPLTIPRAAVRLLPASTTEEVVEGATSAAVVVLAISSALVLALLLAEVIAAVVRAAGRRTWLAENLSRRARLPLRAVLVTVAVWLAIRIVTAPPPEVPGWRAPVEHALLIALILTVAWLIGALAFVVEDAALARYRTDVPDNRHARRVRTQVMVLRRLTVAVLVVCALAAALLTFEGARVAGAGLLASAGLLSVVVGLAAQSTLGNVFAGLQLAFTDAIRVDDVVVVEEEWGRIEEITLTYVVVHLWDDRRLILPSTYFTTTPFENWTRRAADLLGTVELDLDWSVPVEAMRQELTRLLQASELWDHRVGILQVTEAVGGVVRVRALASAADAPTLFDLRCAVREGLVGWLQREHPEALPRTRWEGTGTTGTADGRSTPGVEGSAGRPGGAAAEAGAPGPGPAVGDPGEPTAAFRPFDDDGSTRAVPTQTADEPTGAPVPARAEGEGQPGRVRRRRALGPQDTVLLDPGRHSRLFTGSLWAVERSKAFSGPGQEVIDEREQTAEGLPRQTGEQPRHDPEARGQAGDGRRPTDARP